MPAPRRSSAQHGGRFPDDEAALLALPGIGPYTAAAIRAIAFDHPASAVDGNVERVIARLFAIADAAARRQARDRRRAPPSWCRSSAPATTRRR